MVNETDDTIIEDASSPFHQLASWKQLELFIL
jgi:hypothetical protein